MRYRPSSQRVLVPHPVGLDAAKCCEMMVFYALACAKGTLNFLIHPSIPVGICGWTKVVIAQVYTHIFFCTNKSSNNQQEIRGFYALFRIGYYPAYTSFLQFF